MLVEAFVLGLQEANLRRVVLHLDIKCEAGRRGGGEGRGKPHCDD